MELILETVGVIYLQASNLVIIKANFDANDNRRELWGGFYRLSTMKFNFIARSAFHSAKLHG